MQNKIRVPLEEPEAEEKIEPKQENVAPSALQVFFTRGIISKEVATAALPFIVFLAFLGMIYIGNRHTAENNIRKIDRLNKEVKELSWDFKTLKAELMYKS
ncbi:hypothetical protein EIM50_23600, partial [Pseudoxanthomonas sp. SGD-10]